MNCLQCNAPLEDQARFCRNCGSPVAINSSILPSTSDNPPTMPAPVQQPYYAPQEQWQSPMTLPAAPQSQYAPQGQWMPQAQPMSPQYMPPVAAQPGSMQSMGTSPGAAIPARRKRRWPLRLLITLLVLIVLLAGGWIFAGRPILHSVAQNQFDQLIARQINLLVPLPPAVTSSLTVTENGLNNLITLNSAPSDPVQKAVAHIAPAVVASDGSYTGGVELDFQLFGFSCSIKGIPIASNGQIVMTQVQVSGILSLVMSPDEMTTLLNGHLRDALARLGREATNVVLKNQELDIQLSSSFV
ncbi:MAG TPA: zinc-ribbon domain-containing protein [Ktedonobacteraceae bacterium]